MVAIPQRLDPTLEAVNEAIAGEQSPHVSKNIGFGDIGKCDRWIWNKINATEPELLTADSLRIFRNGHEDEAAMARDLRKVSGLTLYTHDPERGNKQYKFDFLGGRFTGRLDGIAVGLIQAPKTPQIWENKSCNDKKFDKLNKLKVEHQEKDVLREWDFTYFCQAQISMLATDLDRHYMTVCTPGLRRVTSVRTDLDTEFAESLIVKANRIINMKHAPECVCDSWNKFRCST